eukprot:gene46777-58330_t
MTLRHVYQEYFSSSSQSMTRKIVELLLPDLLKPVREDYTDTPLK